jgi:hypothetical protein
LLPHHVVSPPNKSCRDRVCRSSDRFIPIAKPFSS